MFRRPASSVGDHAIGKIAAGTGKAKLSSRLVHHHIAHIHQAADGRRHVVLCQFGTLPKHPAICR